MNILTRFQKIITEKLKKEFNEYLYNITTSFNEPYSINAYKQFIEDFDKFISSLNKETYEAFIQQLDEEFMRSDIRIKTYASRGFVIKPLLTKFGWITLKRRRYENKIDGGSFLYVDRLLGLTKYARLDPFVIADIVEEASLTSYARAGRIVSKTIGEKIKYDEDPNKNILSRATTRNNVLKASEIIDVPENDEYKEISELNIMLDEKFVGSQFNEGKDHMVKAGVLFDSYKTEYKNRIKLTGKRVFGNIEEGVDDLLKEILDYIYFNYDTDKLKRINFMGDGALWIKSFALNSSFKYHKDIIIKFGLDAFHTSQAIQNIVTNKHKEYAGTLMDYLIHNKKEDFIKVIESLIKLEPSREERMTEKKNYLLNNWNYIQTSFHDIKYKCSMESNISHVFADIFTSRPKAYSFEGLKGLLKIRLLKINGYDLKKLYLESLDNKMKTEKEEALLNKTIIKNTRKTDASFQDLLITNTSTQTGKDITRLINEFAI